MSSLGKRLALALGASLLALALGLWIAENWIRSRGLLLSPHATATLFGNGPVEGTLAECYRPSVSRGYEPWPGRCGRNELGVYSDHPVDKADGSFRVLVLGDSIADQQDWVTALEDELQAAWPQRRVETFNAGVVGYDTCSELQALDEIGGALDPDLVLVQFCLNDFMVASTVLPTADGGIVLRTGRGDVEVPRWGRHSHLLLLALAAVQERSVARDDSSLQASLDKVERCVDGFVQATTEQGAELLFVVFPALGTEAFLAEPGQINPVPIFPSLLAAEGQIQEITAARGVWTVPLREDFEGLGPLQDYRSRPLDPWHPSKEGEQLIGAMIAARVTARYGPDGP